MAPVDDAEHDPYYDEWAEFVQPCLCRASAYPYRRLIGTDIRLLNVLPGEGIIECVLHEMPLTEGQDFFAVSYVWGTELEAEEILLDGLPFKVSRNLHGFLHQIREQPETPLKIGYPDEYFWIDAICLNQEDMEEKAFQIPRMMDIYRASLKIVIWLGPNKPMAKSETHGRRRITSRSDPTTMLLTRQELSPDSVVELLFEKARSLWVDWELPDDDSEEDLVLRKIFGESYGAVVRASNEILRRPWFVRLWTIQEGCLELPSTVLAGRHGVLLESLIAVLKAFARRNRLIILAPGYSRIVALGQIEKRLRSKYELERIRQQPQTSVGERIMEILTIASGELAQATDPRDRVYALLGLMTFLVGDRLPTELRPDYRLSYDTIYWAYAAYLFQNSGDLRLLLHSRHELQGVPSWVPDFRYLGSRGEVCRDPTIRVSPNKQVLYLQGVRMENICDKVGEWIDANRLTVGTDSGLQYRIRYVEGRIFKLASQIRNISLEEVLDEFFLEAFVMSRQGGKAGVRKAYSNLKGHSHRNGAWLPQRCREKTTEYLGKEFAIARHIRYSLVLLEDGTILSARMADIDIRPDDVVCVFKGAAQPSIIRPSESGDSFILISQCDIRSGTLSRQKFNKDFWAGRSLEAFQLV
ncbi:heterokaryon incompatibility protein-domain-containing protein [Astrocystis sublimbata]|nr:heterokaryon incompatibility protein-domain-containing protein [Astrocystis sublimbata]